jgi:hypothetical protein
MKKVARRFSLALPTLAAVLVLSTPWEARAGGCKSNGTTCTTDVSCCSRKCAKPAPAPGKAKPMFGVCCATGQTLFNGQCCTPATSCSSGECGSEPNGCGGTVDCGTCDQSQCRECHLFSMATYGRCAPTCPNGECNNGLCVTTTTTTTVTTTTLGCATPCGPCGECVNGECQDVPDETQCGGPFAKCCGGVCRDTDTDEMNCGACGNRCEPPSGAQCRQGDCCQPSLGGSCDTNTPCCMGGMLQCSSISFGTCCLRDGAACTPGASDNCCGFCVSNGFGGECEPS